MGFLSSKGYPTQGAATIINTALKGTANAPAGPLANMKATARGLVGQAKDAMVKQAGNIADKLKPGLKAAPVAQTEPTMEPETPTTTDNYNNQLAGGKQTVNKSTGFDRNTMSNTSEPIDPKAVGGVPSTTNPASAPKQLDPRDLNKNGEVDATEKSIARNKSKKKTPAKPVTTAPETTVTTGKINHGNALKEAGPGVLPQNIIDKAILKAAQEAEIMNTKQGKTSTQQTKSANLAGGAPTDTDGDGDVDATDTAKSSSGGGFAAGLKKGFTGKPKASPDLAGLEQRIAAIEKKVGLA
jgi:hypothetical protein